MEFRILGPLEVSENDHLIEVTAPKQRTLLAILLLSPGRVVSADRLVDELWGGNPPAGGSKTLRFHVSKLRDALEPNRQPGSDGLIVTKAPGYSLEASPENIDAARFERLIRDARRFLSADPGYASERLREALDLWRGPALTDFFDAPFAQLEIARLEELRLGALEDRLDTDLALDRHAEVVVDLEKLTAEHPFRERLWAQLMVALHRCDRQAEALRVYQQLRRHLGQELGIEPSNDLRQLEERILLEDPELQLSPAAPATGMLRGYEMLERLGEGAFGVVWRASQPSVGRDVAIKAIRPEYSNRSEFILGFEAEAQLIETLAHPHIVPIFDFWRDPGGAYLVMRLMEGGSLDTAATSDWTTPQVLRVVEQVGSGLAFAHDRRLVHGDLHPGNVLLDEAGNAYLADFGLSAHPAGANTTPPAGYASPEQRSGEVPGPRSDVYGFGRLVFRILTGEDPGDAPLPSVRTRRPDLPDQVDGVLRRTIAADPALRQRDAGEFLEDLRLALGATPPSLPEPRNPYKGLRPFEEADATDFFGRNDQIKELESAVSDYRLVGVVGPSGSGKSSLVRAGLIPVLRSGGLPGSDSWLYTDLYPGEEPFARLSDALLRVAVAEPPDLLDRLRHPATISATVIEMLPPGAELFVLVDQFEELFTLCPLEDARRRFMDCLAALASDPESRVRVVVTMRADFYGLPLQYQPFGDALRKAVVAITPPGPEDLVQAIVGPAHGVGIEVEPELIADVVDEVATAPGGLPLMQYALTRLFEETDGSTLTAETYRRTGGVIGVLESWPEQLFVALTEPIRHPARQLFLRLVSVDETGQPSRRRVSLTELHQLGIPESKISAVLDEFTSARLLTLDRDPVSRTPTVEVAHDALLDHWSRMHGWIEGRREELVLYRRFRAAQADWEGSGRNPEYLLQGGRLRQFEAWAQGTDLVRTQAEEDFLEKSRAREDEAAATRHRRRRLFTVALALIAMVAAALGAIAFVQRNRANDQQETAEQQASLAEQQAAIALEEGQRAEAQRQIAETERARAEEQEQIARARSLAAAAAAQLEADPELSVLLAIEAVETTRPDGYVLREAEEALHAAVSANRLVTTVAVGKWARSLAYSADGDRFFVGGGNGTGQVIGFPGGEVEAELPYVRTSVFTLGGHNDELLVVADYDGLITVRDAKTLEEIIVLEGYEGWITDLSVSSDGMVLASVSPYDETLIVWNLEQMASVATFSLDCELACSRGVALSADGTVVTSGRTIWDVTTGRQVAEVPLAGPVHDVEFVDNARMIVADGMVARIVDIGTGEIMETLGEHGGDLETLDVSPDGRLAASGARDGLVNVWELGDTGARHVVTLAGHQATVWEVQFAPDGRHLTSLGGRQALPEMLVTWPQDWEARIWDISPSGSPEWMASTTRAGMASFAPDGRTLISGDEGSGATIWDIGDQSPVLVIPGPADTARTAVVAFSPDGSAVVLSGTIPSMSADDTEAGWLRVHDANTGDVIRDLIPPTPGLVPSAVAFSAEGDKLALAAQGLARVWDTTTWEVVLTPSELTDAEHFTAVGFSPDGSLLATMSIPVDLDWPIDVNLWDLATQRDVSQLFHGPRPDRGTTQFSPDGRVILIAGAGRPQIAEPYTGRLLARLEAPPAYAARATFSPDGSRIATAEADGTVRIWDAATAEEQLVLVGHTAEVVSVTFSPTREQLASVSLDGTMRVWALDLSDLLEIARGRVTRDLTDAECRSYIGRGCAPAAAPERLLPAAADWSEAVGISEDAWLSALPGGMWREGPEVPAGGVAFDTESGQLVVFEEWMATWTEEPGTGEWHAGTAIPGSGGEEFGGFGSVVYHPGLDLILVNRIDDGATLGYDVDADTWSELIPGQETFPQCDVKPSECRYGYQMVYDAESELIVLFGGAQWGRIEEGRHAGLGDTWTYDAAATTWTDQTIDEAPPPRVNHTAAYDSQSDRVIVFGGATKVGGEPLGDTWTYDTNTNTWTEMHPVVSPPARAGAMTWYDPQADLVFLFGGAGDWSVWPPMPWLAFGGEELWAYDFESDNWTLYRADPNPGYRLTGEVIFDPRSGEAVLIGGDTYNADRQFQGWIGDVWVYRHDPWVTGGGVTSNHVNGGGSPPPTTPPANPQISLSQGSLYSGQAGNYWYSVSLSGFTPNSSLTVYCNDSVDSNFYSQTMSIDGSGNASDSTLCYSSDGPDYWVTGGGVTSNHVNW